MLLVTYDHLLPETIQIKYEAYIVCDTDFSPFPIFRCSPHPTATLPVRPAPCHFPRSRRPDTAYRPDRPVGAAGWDGPTAAGRPARHSANPRGGTCRQRRVPAGRRRCTLPPPSAADIWQPSLKTEDDDRPQHRRRRFGGDMAPKRARIHA